MTSIDHILLYAELYFKRGHVNYCEFIVPQKWAETVRIVVRDDCLPL